MAWVPTASARTMAIYGDLARRHHVTGNLVPDAQLAALALEYGVAVVPADSDFARFFRGAMGEPAGVTLGWYRPAEPN